MDKSNYLKLHQKYIELKKQNKKCKDILSFLHDNFGKENNPEFAVMYLQKYDAIIEILEIKEILKEV